LVIHQSFKSLFTDSSHVKFGRPLPFFSLPLFPLYFAKKSMSYTIITEKANIAPN
jgi:hypothetical protein